MTFRRPERGSSRRLSLPYTSDKLEEMSLMELKYAGKELAVSLNCETTDIFPPYSRRDLMISSILEAQERGGGS